MSLAIKACVWQLVVFVGTCAILFVSAGTLVWLAGWIFLVLFLGFVAGLSLWLLRHDSCLLDERLTILKPDQPFWDKMWLLLFYACSLCWLVLMPLDTVRWKVVLQEIERKQNEEEVPLLVEVILRLQRV